MAETRRPILVAVSGADGSGKSTLIEAVALLLRAEGRVVTSYRALDCEGHLLSAVRDHHAYDPKRVERFLADLVGWSLVTNTERALALPSTDVLIADRYLVDHLANQLVFGNDLASLTWVRELLPEPDLTVLLEIGPKTAMARVLERDGKTDWQDATFFEAAVAAFDTVSHQISSRSLVRLSADLLPSGLCKQVMEEIRLIAKGGV